jgi:hypothetical protein
MPELPRISGKEARGCVVPLHNALALGTLRSAIRQAGITVEEFVEAQKK